MTRRKREIIGLRNERDFPYLVELTLPPGGFGSIFLEMDAFHRERRIPAARVLARWSSSLPQCGLCRMAQELDNNQTGRGMDGSAHHRWALVVEPPAGDQVLHRLGVVACAQRLVLVEPMRCPDQPRLSGPGGMLV